MNKQKLIADVAAETGIEREKTGKLVDTLLGKIGETIAKGEEVRIVGFGAFSVKRRKASAGRDPRTGAPIKIDAVSQPKFRAGRILKGMIN